MESVFIYGGGNIAHSLAAAISMHQPVNVITRRPEAWGDRLAWAQNGKVGHCKYDVRATSDVEGISQADLIFIALPQFAIDESLGKILPNMKQGATVVFVPAPAKCGEYAQLIKSAGGNIVGFQRVPYIARILAHGHNVQISGARVVHRLAVSDDKLKDMWTNICARWFDGATEYLSSFMTFAFSNSNPLLHPARLKVLLGGGDNGKYKECPYFYAGWTDESSELYIAADKEMRKVFSTCAPEAAACDYESVLKHYGVTTAQELTDKIRSIESFRSILAPWKKGQDGMWEPDLDSRYFTEDIPFGTKIMQEYARRNSIPVPTIDKLAGLVPKHKVGES